MKNTCMRLVVLSLALLLCCAAAQAEDLPLHTSGAYQYVLLEDGTVKIADYSGDAEALEIPSELDEYTVTALGGRAFSYCEGLASVTIPDSVTVIDGNPFSNCQRLTEIRVSPEHAALAVVDGVLFSRPDQCLLCYPCAFTAEAYAVPEGTAAIGAEAFSDCQHLLSVTVPDGVTVIGNGAFANCGSLASAALPDSVTDIGRRAFINCESLSDFTLPGSVVSIGNYAFYACESLSGIDIPGGVTGIGAFAFAGCGSLASVTLPDSVADIGEEAFSFCFSLENVLVLRGSYAEQYCLENSLPCTYVKTNDRAD